MYINLIKYLKEIVIHMNLFQTVQNILIMSKVIKIYNTKIYAKN